MSASQINAKIDEVLAIAAKRLAKERGVPLNVYIADLIAKDLASGAEAIKRQLVAEERQFVAEKEAMLAVLDKYSSESLSTDPLAGGDR